MEGIAGAASILTVLQITAGIIKLCGSYIREVRHAPEDVERLRSKVSALQAVLMRLQKLPPSEINMTAVRDCGEYLSPVIKKLEPKKRHVRMKRIGLTALKWPFTSKEVGDRVRTIEQYLVIFNMTVQLNISEKTTDSEHDRLLDKLAYVGDAVLTSYETSRRHRQCLPGTRIDVLQQIMDWAVDSSPQCIFWLKGLAGTGKSTITTTVASILKARSSRLATYFFKRGHSDLAHVRKLIPAVVRQLSAFSSSYRQSVLAVIKKDPAIGHSADLREQYEALLVEPLRYLQPLEPSGEPFIIVLDALDECDDETDIRMLLNLFATTNDLPELRLKLFVSSRPDLSRHGFEEMPSILHYTTVLHDVPRAVVDGDIRIYLGHELSAIQKKFRLPAEWPSTEEQEVLAEKAGGLFIFAATACRFIGGAPYAKPQERLEQVCNSVTSNKLITEELDQIYIIVLQASIKGRYTDEEQEINRARFANIVGSIVILLDPLSISQLFALLDRSHVKSQQELEGLLQPLHSVIDVPDDAGKPVRPLHLSFHEFLLDSNRCVDYRFWVDEELTHRYLALNCLRLLSSSLRRNVCAVSSLGTRRVDIDRTVIEDAFPPAVKYACLHWVDHAVRGKLVIVDYDFVHKFLQQHLLHWLETMSLIGRTSKAIVALNGLMRATITSSFQSQQALLVNEFIRDCHLFATTFRHVIGKAPEQVYASALLFSPTQSVVWQQFASTASWVRLKPAFYETWNSCRQTYECSYRVIEAWFLPGDRSLVTSDTWQNIDTWSVQTGERQKRTIPSNKGSWMIKSSPDGLKMLSISSQGVPRIWDTAKGHYTFTFEKGPGMATSIAFSEDSRIVSLGHDNGMMQLLGTAEGDLRGDLKCEFQLVKAMKFSPHGKFIAAVSIDLKFQLWDVQRSSLLLTVEPPVECPLYLETNELIAFSLNEELMALGFESQFIRLWNLTTCQILISLESFGECPDKIFFSPNCGVLASTSNSGPGQWWNLQTGASGSIVEGITVAFSPDSKLLASGSIDGKIRVRDMDKYEVHCILEGHTSNVTSLTFSDNGETLLSASLDQTARIWDLQGHIRCPILDEDEESIEDPVLSLYFSHDGKLVVSSTSKKVQVWDVETGDCRSESAGYGCLFSSFSQYARTVSDEGVRLIDIRTGYEHRLPESKLHVLSQDGLLLAFVTGESTIHVWNVRDAVELTKITCQPDPEFEKLYSKVHQNGVNSANLIFSPDGALIASNLRNNLKIWNIHTRERMVSNFLASQMAVGKPVVFSPDNMLLAVVQPGPYLYSYACLQIWDIHSGLLRLSVEYYNGGISFDFSSRILTFVLSKYVLIYNVYSGQCIRTIPCLSLWPRIQFLPGVDAVLVDGEAYPTDSTESTDVEVARCTRSVSAFQISWPGKWVTRSSERILWLPPERRPGKPGHYAVWGNHVAIASRNGQMTFLTFTDDLDSQQQDGHGDIASWEIYVTVLPSNS